MTAKARPAGTPKSGAAVATPQAAPPPGWAAPAAPAGPRAPVQSGMLKAAVILLLVGAILWAAMAAFVLVFALFFGVVFAALGESGGDALGGLLVGATYGVWGILCAAGAICGFVGWRKASRGDLDGGFTWGLVGSLLPPLNVVALLGAIFLKVCPEHEAQERARQQAWAPPR